MVENIIFSLDRVLPFFLLILLGYSLKALKIIPEAFLSSVNRYVYRVALPVNLFISTASMETAGENHTRFLVWAFLLTVGAALLIWAITELLFPDKKIIGTLVQGAFRSNYSLLGIPLATAVVGASAAAPAAMALAVIVPTYSIISVIALFTRGSSTEKPNPKKILIGVISQPVFIGTLLGLAAGLVHLPLPNVINQTLQQVAGTATPLGLMAIGGLFDAKIATARLKPALYSSLIKIGILPVLAVGAAYLLGFRGTSLFLYYIMFGAPVAVSSYSTASELGGDPHVASNIMIITTLFSSLTLSLGIYIMRSLGWI